MELEDLITKLQAILDDAKVAWNTGSVDEAKECLRAAKQLLDDKFLKD